MRRPCAYSLDFHLLVQETSPIHPGQPSASSASADSSSSSTAARKEKEPEQEHQQEQQQKPKEEAASHTSTQTDAHADTTTNDPWHGLDFMHAPLPPSTDSFDFPPQTTAKGLPGSKFTYVSAIVYKAPPQPNITLCLADFVAYNLQRQSVERQGRVGAIAVHPRLDAKTKKTRLDVEFVVVDSKDNKARAVKPSELLPAPKTDTQTQSNRETKAAESESKAAPSPIPPQPQQNAAQQLAVINTAAQWAFKTHVSDAAKRAVNKAKAEATLQEARNLRSRSAGGSVSGSKGKDLDQDKHRDKEGFAFTHAIAQSLDPLTHAVSALQQNQLALAEAIEHAKSGSVAGMSSSTAPGTHAETALTTLPSLCSLSSPLSGSGTAAASASPDAGATSLLSAALVHSQLSAMHLAQQSVLLSAFISPTMMHAASSASPFTALPGFPPHNNTAPTSTPTQEPVKEPARKRQRRQCDFHAFCLCCCLNPFLMFFFGVIRVSRCNSCWFFLAESRPAALTPNSRRSFGILKNRSISHPAQTVSVSERPRQTMAACACPSSSRVGTNVFWTFALVI